MNEYINLDEKNIDKEQVNMESLKKIYIGKLKYDEEE